MKESKRVKRVTNPYNLGAKNGKRQLSTALESYPNTNLISNQDQTYKIDFTQKDKVKNLKTNVRKKQNIDLPRIKDRDLLQRQVYIENKGNYMLNPGHQGSLSQNEIYLNKMVAQKRVEYDLLNNKTLIG